MRDTFLQLVVPVMKMKSFSYADPAHIEGFLVG